MERLNMRREGHLLKNIFFKRDEEGNPIWNDTYEYAILAEEWFGLGR
jgi:RimJ/RimL family protein N-acetyltransferase